MKHPRLREDFASCTFCNGAYDLLSPTCPVWPERHGPRDPAGRVVAVAAACVDPEAGTVLLVDHPTLGPALPGGKVEPGESLLAALARELFEETEVTLGEPLLVGVDEQPAFVLYTFAAHPTVVNCDLNREGRRVWHGDVRELRDNPRDFPLLLHLAHACLPEVEPAEAAARDAWHAALPPLFQLNLAYHLHDKTQPSTWSWETR